MSNETIGTMLHDGVPTFALDPRSARQEVVGGRAPIHDADRRNEGCRPHRPYGNGHDGPSEAPGIKSRGGEKYQFQDPIVSFDQ